LHGTVRKLLAVGTMTFAASSLMVGTAFAAKEPKLRHPVAMTFNVNGINEGTAKLTYTASTVDVVMALKKNAVVPLTSYNVYISVNNTPTLVCTFKSSKKGTGKCDSKHDTANVAIAGKAGSVALFAVSGPQSGMPEAGGQFVAPGF
jgi:hypothetical protein